LAASTVCSPTWIGTRNLASAARLEPVIRAELGQSAGAVDAYVLDEIGKRECLCPSFVEAVRGVLDGPGPVLATIA
jgi:nucleoside-triphosphatase THEP1